jgi:hypothetical protein
VCVLASMMGIVKCEVWTLSPALSRKVMLCGESEGKESEVVVLLGDWLAADPAASQARRGALAREACYACWLSGRCLSGCAAIMPPGRVHSSGKWSVLLQARELRIADTSLSSSVCPLANLQAKSQNPT